MRWSNGRWSTTSAGAGVVHRHARRCRRRLSGREPQLRLAAVDDGGGREGRAAHAEGHQGPDSSRSPAASGRSTTAAPVSAPTIAINHARSRRGSIRSIRRRSACAIRRSPTPTAGRADCCARVKVHESVINRIATGTDRYAPITLPETFGIVPPQVEGETAPQADNQTPDPPPETDTAQADGEPTRCARG